METRKRSVYYKTLEEVTDFKLSTLVNFWNRLPKIIRLKLPYAKSKIIFRNLAMASALYITGGRASEVAHIRVRDVSFEDGWIYIKLINRKNKKNPTKEIMANLEIEQVFLNWLVKYYKYRISVVNDMDEPLFPTIINNIEYNIFLPQQSVYNHITKYVGINPHFFRKLRASHLLEYYGFDIKPLQQYLGWSSVLSSEPYLRISKSGIKKSYLQHQDDVKKIIEGVGK